MNPDQIPGEYGRAALSLAAVFSLLFLTVRKFGPRKGETPLKRFFARNSEKPDKALERLERLTLTPQHTLHLVRLGDREILVATHPHGCSLLDRAPVRNHALARGAEA